MKIAKIGINIKTNNRQMVIGSGEGVGSGFPPPTVGRFLIFFIRVFKRYLFYIKCHNLEVGYPLCEVALYQSPTPPFKNSFTPINEEGEHGRLFPLAMPVTVGRCGRGFPTVGRFLKIYENGFLHIKCHY